MKPKLRRVKELEAQVVNQDIQLSLASNDLTILNYNIDQLLHMKRTLEYNKKFLKKEKVIATVTEYRRSIDELKSINESLKTYEGLKKKLESDIEEFKKNHIELIKEFEKAKKELNEEKIILRFKGKNERSRSNKKKD